MKKNGTPRAQIESIVSKYRQAGRNIHEYCERIYLYYNEITTLAYIAESSTTNMTDIAGRLGITRGAVTKLTTKLEKMGLLVRYKYKPKQKEIFVHLTELGVKAYEGFREMNRLRESRLDRYFERMDEKEQEAVTGYLEHFAAVMDEYFG